VYEVYPDRTGLYRWRFLLRSGDVLANSATGFIGRDAACRALDEFRAAVSDPGETRGCPKDESHLRVVR
jgi:uncharacterized protein YegP (UPF0339 family)